MDGARSRPYKPVVLGKPLASRKEQPVALLDDPPMGHMQALVLVKLHELGPRASGFEVLKALSMECGVYLDPSQVYASIRKLVKRDPPFIKQITEVPSPEGGPPFKIYRVTEEGRQALGRTAAHYLEVATRLGGAVVFDDNGQTADAGP